MNCSERSSPHAAATILGDPGRPRCSERRRAATSRVRLTTDGTLKLAPVFIDNGDEIVFATHESPTWSQSFASSSATARGDDCTRRSSITSSIRHFPAMGVSTRTRGRQLHLKWCW